MLRKKEASKCKIVTQIYGYNLVVNTMGEIMEGTLLNDKHWRETQIQMEIICKSI